jgi:hypothetical protein
MNKEQFQKHCEMQANWWMAYALTGACKNRKVHHGSFDGPLFTAEELVQDALDAAQNHIRLFRESCES